MQLTLVNFEIGKAHLGSWYRLLSLFHHRTTRGSESAWLLLLRHVTVSQHRRDRN